MRSIWFIIALVPISARAESHFFTQLESFSYSEPVSINAALDQLQGDFTPGEEAFTHNEIALGFRRGPWSFSWLARYDYHLRFHSDTAELIYLEENRLPVQHNRTYQVDMKSNRLSAQGLRLAYAFEPAMDIQMELAVSYLRASQLIDGKISGAITTDDSGHYSGQAWVDYVYNRDLLLERPVNAATGQGLTLDLHADWQINPHWAVGITSQDLFNIIRWNNAPYTTAQVSSSVVTFDANGFIDTQPVLSGVEGYRSHSQHLPVRTTSWVNWQRSEQLQAGVELFSVGQLLFPRIKVQQHWSARHSLGASWDFKAQALGLSYHYQGLQLSFISDNINISDAHTLGLSLGWSIPLSGTSY